MSNINKLISIGVIVYIILNCVSRFVIEIPKCDWTDKSYITPILEAVLVI